MEQIRHGIYVETAYSGVTLGAIVLPYGIVMIDAPMRPEDARTWRSALGNLGGGANRLLVNLDAHPDRTLGARAQECPIIAHQKTAAVFRSRPNVFKGPNVESGAEWESYNDAVGTRWAAPDLTFTHRINIYWGSPTITLEHHPGPSAGAVWAILPEHKVIFVGDAVLYRQPPFMASADLPAWMLALEHLAEKYPDYQVISGRGGAVPAEAVAQQHQFLKCILKALEKIAKRNATSDVVETIVPGLLDELEFPAQLSEQYLQRLRHGLGQYYQRRYRPTESANSAKIGIEEQ
jgi:glyoxylase-like metal-dependent hydrolase (beta-lactamase superfamily II)